MKTRERFDEARKILCEIIGGDLDLDRLHYVKEPTIDEDGDISFEDTGDDYCEKCAEEAAASALGEVDCVSCPDSDCRFYYCTECGALLDMPVTLSLGAPLDEMDVQECWLALDSFSWAADWENPSSEKNEKVWEVVEHVIASAADLLNEWNSYHTDTVKVTPAIGLT